MIKIRTDLPPRQVVVCNLEEHNAVPQILRKQEKLTEKWQLVIVDPENVGRAATSFQEIVDEKRVTTVFMTETLDHKLYIQIRDFCIANGIDWEIVSEKESE